MRHAPTQPEGGCPPCVGALLGALVGFTGAAHTAFGTAPREATFSRPDGLYLVFVGGAVGLALAALGSLVLGGAVGLVRAALSLGRRAGGRGRAGAEDDDHDKTSLRRAHS
jgi:hypothetical protein